MIKGINTQTLLRNEECDWLMNVKSNLDIIDFIFSISQFKVYHLISQILFWFMKLFLV